MQLCPGTLLENGQAQGYVGLKFTVEHIIESSAFPFACSGMSIGGDCAVMKKGSTIFGPSSPWASLWMGCASTYTAWLAGTVPSGTGASNLGSENLSEMCMASWEPFLVDGRVKVRCTINDCE